MLKVVTLATLFPSSARPQLGVFVERQTLALAGLGHVAVETVSGVGLPPWPASLHPHYRPLARLPERESWKGLSVHRPRFRVLPKIGEADAGRSLARAALPIVRELEPDVVAADFFWPDGVAAMHVARALGLPFSIKARGADVHYWGGRRDIGGQLLEAAMAANGLLAVSEALKRDMVALGMPEEKIRVHYTGIDHDRFRPADRACAKAKLGVSGPLLVTAGALIPRKAQGLTIAATAMLPEATLLIVGDGPDRAELERLARPLGERVRFLGSRPHDELPPLYGAADLMVLPSSSEGLANVWVEALACGTPILIADVGGARELLDRPEAGRIVERDPASIAAAAREMLAEAPSPDAVARTAERFSWERNAAELADFLSAIAR
jgi:teichuronic acid biosynthesis glycosyltransferase TuaC